MCFSAPASFALSGVLGVTGGASMRVARTRTERLIAYGPFAFGIQQALEGFQWLALNSGAANMTLAYAYLFFALLFWPVFVPVVSLMHERKRKYPFYWLTGAGLLSALLYLYAVVDKIPDVFVMEGSIRYVIHVPFFPIPLILYIVAVLGSFYFSSDARIRRFGVWVALSVAISAIFYSFAFASVWCFFAAGLSVGVWGYLRKGKKLRV